MDLLQGLLIITVVHTLGAALPGPDFVLVSQQTLTHGKRAGLLSSVGIALGLSIHILYSALGLAAVIANSSQALWFIKLFGGCYLIYLGINILRTQSNYDTDPKCNKTVPELSAFKIISMGFLCNALNPKVPVYFVALFTIVLSADMPLYQIAIYGIWMMLIQLLWFSLVAVMLSHPTLKNKLKKAGNWINRILGGTMVLLGIKLLITRMN